MKSDPIMRDVKTGTDNVFGNIIGNPTPANLMSDPLGTELVAGLTGPISAETLPTDSTEVMGQPPQVEFTGGDGNAPSYTPADEDTTEVKGADSNLITLVAKAKSIVSKNWKWLVGTGVVIGGVLYVRR
tara:strand:+ start:227 stop:613 length:387 start_codon:yes stop_codon:yes gene_type:complete